MTWWAGPNSPQRHNRRWTDAEIAALAEAYRAGVAYDRLATLTGHPEGSCSTKVSQLARDGLLELRMARHPRTEPPPMRAAA